MEIYSSNDAKFTMAFFQVIAEILRFVSTDLGDT